MAFLSLSLLVTLMVKQRLDELFTNYFDWHFVSDYLVSEGRIGVVVDAKTWKEAGDFIGSDLTADAWAER